MNINPRCRFASSQTPLLCVCKEPRAWKPPAIQSHVFQTFSFIVHNSQLIAQNVFCLILLAGLGRFAWVKQISIPIAVVLRCPFKISSTAVAVYLHRPMQYICSKKPMRCPDKVTALHPLTHRIVFVNAPQCLNRCNESPLLCRWIAFHPAMNRLYFVKKAPFVFSFT